MNLSNELKNAMTPNQEVIAAIVETLPEELVQHIKKTEMSQWDFAMFIIKLLNEVLEVPVADAWDHIFGKGTYVTFKNGVMDALQEKA